MYVNEMNVAGIIFGDITLNEGEKDVVAKFTVYTSSLVINKETGEYKEFNKLYINCISFGERALAIKSTYKKGDKIFIRGPLQISSYEVNGKKNKNVQIIVQLIAKQVEDILENPPDFDSVPMNPKME